MKDGIYRMTLTIEGRPVVAEGSVRGGVLQGLGELSGIVGVFALDDAEAGSSALSAQERDAAGDDSITVSQSKRSYDEVISSMTSNRSQPGLYESVDVDDVPLCIRRKTDIVSTATDRQRERAGDPRE